MQTYCHNCIDNLIPNRVSPDGLCSSLVLYSFSHYKQNFKLNSYPVTIFCPENAVCFLCLLHIFKCTSDFFKEANNIKIDQTASLEQSYPKE